MFRNECYFCGCSDCSNDGHGGRFSYSKEKYCSVYNCHKRLNCFEKKYCSDHTKECPNSNCRIEISIFDEYCSEHGRGECEWENCSNIVSYRGYCSQCLSKKRKECKEAGCDNQIAITNECCDLHERHSCRFDNCSATVIGKANHYCYNHVNPCQENGCSIRTSSGENYCLGHKYNCLENNCLARISRSNNYCSQHIYNAFDKERNEKNNLQTQLNNANAKITRAQTNLGINNLDDLATELQNSAGVIWSLARWKEELRTERESAENMDNFYRRQFILNNDLDNVRDELSEQILAINRESRQKEQENKELKEVINSLENIVIQTRDSLLVEKIENKRNQLEQLKVNIRNNLNGNWYETLEDILEAQKAFIQGGNELNLNQLRRFKQRLLNSGQQITQADLNEICQVQAELSFLELKLEQEQKFQAQIEIN